MWNTHICRAAVRDSVGHICRAADRDNVLHSHLQGSRWRQCGTHASAGLQLETRWNTHIHKVAVRKYHRNRGDNGGGPWAVWEGFRGRNI